MYVLRASRFDCQNTNVFVMILLAVVAGCAKKDDAPLHDAGAIDAPADDAAMDGGVTTELLAQAMIGASGGELRTPDGVVLTIPAGAVTGDTQFAISRVSSGPAAMAGVAQVGDIYRLAPSGMTFPTPVRLDLPVPAASASTTGDLLGLHLSDGDTTWRAIAGAEPTATTVTIFTRSFSLFVLARIREALSACADPSTCSLSCSLGGRFPASCDGSCTILGTGQPGGLSCEVLPVSDDNPLGTQLECRCTGPGSAGRRPLRIDGLVAAMLPSQAMYALATQCGWPCGRVAPPPPTSTMTTFAVGAAATMSGRVQVTDVTTSSATTDFFAFTPDFRGGVEVSSGDVNGDHVDDLVVGAASMGQQVRVLDGVTHEQLNAFLPFDTSFAGGVRVASGDLDADGVADFVIGAGPGAGPQVKVFDGATATVDQSFFAFEPSFAGGVFVATGDVNGDGHADIVVGAGSGAGPQVKVFDGVTFMEVQSFFAFEPSFRGGLRVATGDLDGDSHADIVVGAASSSPQVRVFDGATGMLEQSFFAFAPDGRAGVTVATGDVTRDGHPDVVVGQGPGGGQIRVFDGITFRAVAEYAPFVSTFAGGVTVATTTDGRATSLPDAGVEEPGMDAGVAMPDAGPPLASPILVATVTPTARMLVASTGAADRLVADTRTLTWSVPRTASLITDNYAGSSRTTLTSGVAFDFELVDRLSSTDSRLVFADAASLSSTFGAVRMMNLSTSTMTDLVPSAPGLGLIAVTSTHVYYSSGGGIEIRRVPLAGGTPELVVSGTGSVAAMAVAGSYVYWVRMQDPPFAPSCGLFRAPMDGSGAPEALYEETTTCDTSTRPITHALLVYGGRIYFGLVHAGPSIEVFMMPEGGGPVTTLLREPVNYKTPIREVAGKVVFYGSTTAEQQFDVYDPVANTLTPVRPSLAANPAFDVTCNTPCTTPQIVWLNGFDTVAAGI